MQGVVIHRQDIYNKEVIMSLFNKFVSSELRIKTKPSRSSGKPPKTKTKHPASSRSSIVSSAKAGLSISASLRALKTAVSQQGAQGGGGGGLR